MVNDYQGSRVDPGVAEYLRDVWFADSSAAIDRLMQEQQGSKAV